MSIGIRRLQRSTTSGDAYSQLTVGIIGGSGIDEASLRSKLAARGYDDAALYVDTPAGKTLSNTDSNGRNATQSIAAAISETAGYPDVYVIDLNSTDTAATITSQVNALLPGLTPDYAKGSRLIWLGRTNDSSAFNDTAAPLVTARRRSQFVTWNGIGDRMEWLADLIGPAHTGKDGGWRPYKVLSEAPSRPTGSTWTDPATSRTFSLVRYEDVYVAGDTFRQTCARVTGGRVMTLPEGVFEWDDFAMGDAGYLWYGLIIGSSTGGFTGLKGFMGSGPGTILRMREKTSTKAEDLANPPTSGSTTQQLTQMLFNHCDDALLCNLTFEGADQDTSTYPTYYTGVKFSRCMRPTVAWVHIRGAGNGWRNGPPGEAFSVIFYDNTGTVSYPIVHDCDIDGRRPDGARVAAANLSFNGPNNGQANRIWSHHTAHSHGLVYWLSGNCSTEDYWATDIGYTNSNGDQLSLCVNHEQAKATITHNRPRWILNGKYSAIPGHTLNAGMHFSAWSTTDDTSIVISDPINDAGPNGTSILSCDMRSTYGGGGIAGAGYNVITTMPVVTKNNTALAIRSKSSKSVIPGDTLDNTIDIYTVTFWT